MRILIIGGGIGGLALAHGLRRAGLTADVFERTQQRTDWLQGYRIHINPAGARALRNCLDPAAWTEFVESVSRDGGGFAFLADNGRELLSLTGTEISGTDESTRHHGVSRLRLREILLSGLDVHHGREFVRYEIENDKVTAHFADGTSETGDLLIGADGANSRVRAQLLPHAAARQDTGVVAIAGKHPLPARGLAETLTTRTTLVIPRGPGSLFTSIWLNDGAGYVLWGFSDAATRLPATVTDLDGAALRHLVARRLDGWSPEFRRLVEGSDPATINALTVKSATPVDPWPTGPVTLLGDAIHNMTPMAGVGANTALRDADLLRRKLIAATSGRSSLITELAAYEREMLAYGFAAVRLSLRNARRAGFSTYTSRLLFRSVLRLTAAVPPMRRAMARDLGR